MKNLLFISFYLTFISCSSVRVYSDHDIIVDFDSYSTYAFFQPGIDEVKISDLDKKRILNAIESELGSKNLTKSETPDLLINIAVKSSNDIYINQNNGLGYGFGYGYGYGWGWPNNSIARVSTNTNGMLFIDLIDTKTKQLVWQGKGDGYLNEYSKKRNERIQEFVSEILKKYPPNKEKTK
tara:strand:- start:3312 stop:3854 length:543 start_codon:yes stop_codon:yes gene_type:complete